MQALWNKKGDDLYNMHLSYSLERRELLRGPFIQVGVRNCRQALIQGFNPECMRLNIKVVKFEQLFVAKVSAKTCERKTEFHKMQ